MQLSQPLGCCARLLLALIATAMLSACSSLSPSRSVSLERNALLRQVFPQSGPSAAKNIYLLELNSAEAGHPPLLQSQRAQIKPEFVVRLDPSHAVLLTSGQRVEDNDEVIVCHACQLWLGAYFFTLDSQGWKLTARQDEVTGLGLEGEPGKMAIQRFGTNGYAFSSQWGSCWQGECGTWLILVRLQADKASVLADGIATSADNSGAFDDCSSGTDNAPPLHRCFDLASRWKIDGEQLRIDFSGNIRALDATGRRLPTQSIHQRAVYVLKNGKFSLLQGKNPVPEF